MGEYSHFRFGQKAPNNGVYMEIGETGSMVNDPKIIKLKAGEKFPQNSNFDRVWTRDKN
ncbi:YjzC family protein [Virgibacillus necropolis]|uniref:YjzC family protein n=1 Tax=Virgibacillus necropolis TaxID=163877 RepID=UPI00384DC48F